MISITKRILLVGTLLTVYVTAANNAPGGNSLQFLKLPKSANAASMAEAVSALSGNVFSIFYNPAGVFSTKTSQDYLVNYTRLHGEMNYLTAGAKYKLNNIGDIAVGARFLMPGVQTKTVLNGGQLEENGTFNNISFEITGNFSKGIIKNRLKVGGSIKTAIENLGDDGSSTRLPALVFDVGTILNGGILTPMLMGLNIGVSLNNVGFKIGADSSANQYPLPSTIHGGASYLWWINQTHDLTISGETETLFAGKDADENYITDFKFLIGIRYRFKKMVTASVGYKVGEGKYGIKAGAGINIKGLNLNYCFEYREMNQYNIINSIDLGYAIQYKAKPVNVDALYFAGQKAFASRKYEDAENYFSQLLKIKPNYKDAKLRLSEIKKIRLKQQRLKVFEEAMQEIQ